MSLIPNWIPALAPAEEAAEEESKGRREDLRSDLMVDVEEEELDNLWAALVFIRILFKAFKPTFGVVAE